MAKQRKKPKAWAGIVAVDSVDGMAEVPALVCLVEVRAATEPKARRAMVQAVRAELGATGRPEVLRTSGYSEAGTLLDQDIWQEDFDHWIDATGDQEASLSLLPRRAAVKTYPVTPDLEFPFTDELIAQCGDRVHTYVGNIKQVLSAPTSTNASKALIKRED